MNVPAIAKKTFDQFKDKPEFNTLVRFVLEHLRKMTNPFQRVDFIHRAIDDLNEEVFAHPLVKEMSPCKEGCSACCHTQVSVTDDEAGLLAKRVSEGLEIDLEKLKLQVTAGDDDSVFYKMNFEERKCIFLGLDGGCRVYNDRPSVCRTNAVIGNASQCDTTNGVQRTQLIKTPKADMVIYASFYNAKSSGALPHMVAKALGLR